MLPSSVLGGIPNRIEAGLDVREVAEGLPLGVCKLCRSLMYLCPDRKNGCLGMAGDKSCKDVERCEPTTSRRYRRTNTPELVEET